MPVTNCTMGRAYLAMCSIECFPFLPSFWCDHVVSIINVMWFFFFLVGSNKDNIIEYLRNAENRSNHKIKRDSWQFCAKVLRRLSAIKMELRVGNKYRLGRKIGSGSFGDIYIGMWPSPWAGCGMHALIYPSAYSFGLLSPFHTLLPSPFLSFSLSPSLSC